MIESLDEKAARLGVTRQCIVKVALAERLEKLAHLRAHAAERQQGRRR